MTESDLQRRIEYSGELAPVIRDVLTAYGLGRYQTHKIVTTGYDDFNILVSGDQGGCFLKMFSAERDRAACERYIGIVQAALNCGVRHPQILEHPGGPLYSSAYPEGTVNLCVMELLEGSTLFELGVPPSSDEIREFGKQAALINGITLDVAPVYDSWAIPSFKEEFEKSAGYLSPEQLRLVEPLVKLYADINLESLPYSLVHGDLRTTNLFKTNDGALFVLDFSVANFYPRIVELAVLLADLKVTDNIISEFEALVLEEYQSHLPLEDAELSALPVFIKVASAMNLLAAQREKIKNGNSTAENAHWISVGERGLKAAPIS